MIFLVIPDGGGAAGSGRWCRRRGRFLTEQVRRAPYSIVLFDEVEKGHPAILDLLLGVLDEGRLTDAKGRFCDFTNTIVLFTSNLGVRESMAAGDNNALRESIILDAVRANLRPELYNRIGQVIPFHPLGMPELERIVQTQLKSLNRKLQDDREVTLETTPVAVDLLARLPTSTATACGSRTSATAAPTCCGSSASTGSPTITPS